MRLILLGAIVVYLLFVPCAEWYAIRQTNKKEKPPAAEAIQLDLFPEDQTAYLFATGQVRNPPSNLQVWP